MSVASIIRLASNFFLRGEESTSDLRETLLKSELQSAAQHVWADNLFVLGVHDYASATIVMLVQDVSLLHDRQFAVILVSARLARHECSVLFFEIIRHLLYVFFIFFSAANNKRRFKEFNHGLQDQVFQSSEITSPISGSHLLESDLHLFPNLLDAVVSLLHLNQFGLQNLLRSLDV